MFILSTQLSGLLDELVALIATFLKCVESLVSAVRAHAKASRGWNLTHYS